MSTVPDYGEIIPGVSRPNSDIALVVEVGLLLKDRQGTTQAAEFLRENGVPFRVIVRVLSEPSQRRQPVGA